MKQLIIYALIIVWGSVSCTTSRQHNLLSHADVFVLQQKGAELFQYWEFSNQASLWGECKKLPQHIQAYSDSLAGLMGPEVFDQNRQKVAMQDHQLKYGNALDGDGFNVQLVRAAKAGHVRPINVLEAHLLYYKMGRYTQLSQPTAFHCFILIHDSIDKVRCYFGANDQP